MTLWSVFRSPLLFGGDLRKLDDWTRFAVDRPLSDRCASERARCKGSTPKDDFVVWVSQSDARKYVACFICRMIRPVCLNPPGNGCGQWAETCMKFGRTGRCRLRMRKRLLSLRTASLCMFPSRNRTGNWADRKSSVKCPYAFGAFKDKMGGIIYTEVQLPLAGKVQGRGDQNAPWRGYNSENRSSERCRLQRRQAENLRAVGRENKTGNHCRGKNVGKTFAFDLAELRIDFFEDVEHPDQVGALLAEINSIYKKPLLFTFPHQKRGRGARAELGSLF